MCGSRCRGPSFVPLYTGSGSQKGWSPVFGRVSPTIVTKSLQEGPLWAACVETESRWGGLGSQVYFRRECCLSHTTPEQSGSGRFLQEKILNHVCDCHVPWMGVGWGRGSLSLNKNPRVAESLSDCQGVPITLPGPGKASPSSVL